MPEGAGESGRPWWPSWLPWIVLGSVVLAGIWLRVSAYGQSLIGDELSTLWIVRTHGLSGVLDVVSGDAEITPPLYFTLAWIASKLGSAPELVRLPSLIAGVLSLPLYYLLGLRLFGRTAAWVATAVASLAPFLVYFSANGRAYSVMIFLLLLSTVALLRAADTGKARWWVVYGLASCLAMYSHYIGCFVLIAQFAWLLWAFPERRLAALISNAGAALLFLPWIPSFFADSNSPTTPILEALQDDKLVAVEQLLFWEIDGGVWSLSDRWDAALIGLGVLVGVAGVLFARRRRASAPVRDRTGTRLARVDRNLVLAVLLAVATPLGALVLGTFSTDIFGGRNLAGSWTGIPLLLGALVAAASTSWATVATVLMLAGFAVGSIHLADPTRSDFRYRDAAEYIEREATAKSAVLDSSHLTPAPLTPLAAYLDFDGAQYAINLPVTDPPFLANSPVADPDVQMDQAFAGTDRVFVVTLGGHEDIARNQTVDVLGQHPIPPGWRIDHQHTIDGIYGITVTVIDRVPSAGPAGSSKTKDDQ